MVKGNACRKVLCEVFWQTGLLAKEVSFGLGWTHEVVNSVHFNIFSLKTRIDKLEKH